MGGTFLIVERVSFNQDDPNSNVFPRTSILSNLNGLEGYTWLNERLYLVMLRARIMTMSPTIRRTPAKVPPTI